MTVSALRAEIVDVMVFVGHLLFIMTRVAGIGGAPVRMAFGTIPAGSAVIDVKAVTKARPAPAAGIVALGALARVMIARAGMARLTISGSRRIVVEVGRLPRARIVAGRAWTAVMISRRLAPVTGSAVGAGTRMIERGGLPGAGAVAGRALAAKVVGWPLVAVAGLAVGGAGSTVVEARGLPGAGVVAR